MKTSIKKQNILFLLIFVILIGFPLLFNPSASYEGSDGQAEEAISEIQPSYEPWFEPFWEPPSGEIESLLFTLFAVIGSSTIAYTVGRLSGKKND